MPDPLFAPIDLYCERLSAELLAEPLNLVSNLAFVIAGLWGVAAARRQEAGRGAEAMGWWVVAIGIGSAIFHSWATRLTIWADVVPIATFTIAYTLFNLRRFMGMAWPPAVAIFVAFYAVVGFGTYMVPDWLRQATNGSTGYLPPFLALIVFGMLVLRQGNPAGWYNLAAAAVFCVSVTFRMLDPVVCGSLPIGTHFLWHVFNGLMLAVILAAVARHGAARRV